MAPLPAPIGGGEFVAWRLNEAIFAASWDSGEGAFRYGGRWSSRGIRAVYCSLEPAVAILEVAVHRGFGALDTIPHVLSRFTIDDPTSVHVVKPGAIPNPNWLRPCPPSAGQQAFGDELLRAHKFVLIPSAVSTHSWNLIFVAEMAKGAYSSWWQEAFALDTRLYPPRGLPYDKFGA